MQAFTTCTSKIIPLDMNNIDTDMIIPAQHLRSVSSEGYGEFLFENMKQQNPDFVFNDPQYKDAKILIGRRNFGCGSSRVHAVWALLQAGIRVVIAESFHDIFFNNAAKNGLLLITLPKAIINKWFTMAQQQPTTLSIDLATQSIINPNGETTTFTYDDFRKDCLLKGYDDLDYLIENTGV